MQTACGLHRCTPVEHSLTSISATLEQHAQCIEFEITQTLEKPWPCWTLSQLRFKKDGKICRWLTLTTNRMRFVGCVQSNAGAYKTTSDELQRVMAVNASTLYSTSATVYPWYALIGLTWMMTVSTRWADLSSLMNNTTILSSLLRPLVHAFNLSCCVRHLSIPTLSSFFTDTHCYTRWWLSSSLFCKVRNDTSSQSLFCDNYYWDRYDQLLVQNWLVQSKGKDYESSCGKDMCPSSTTLHLLLIARSLTRQSTATSHAV